MVNHFTLAEIACPCCKQAICAVGFLDAMNMLREDCGHALKVNSWCRCAKHNAKVGGKDGSFHLITAKGDGLVGACAVDISTEGWDGAKRWRFIEKAMRKRFSIGIAKNFIHVDLRAAYAESGWKEPVFFHYL